jgi:hypothetical protein
VTLPSVELLEFSGGELCTKQDIAGFSALWHRSCSNMHWQMQMLTGFSDSHHAAGDRFHKQKIGHNKTARSRPEKSMLNPISLANTCQARLMKAISRCGVSMKAKATSGHSAP